MEIKKFKTLQEFKEKVKKSLCWEDYFKIGKYTYKIFTLKQENILIKFMNMVEVVYLIWIMTMFIFIVRNQTI